MRWLSLVALAAVILQGVLGGLRVVLDERTLAMIHGCVGPAFFALCRGAGRGHVALVARRGTARSRRSRRGIAAAGAR